MSLLACARCKTVFIRADAAFCLVRRSASTQELAQRGMTTPAFRFVHFLWIAGFKAMGTAIAQLPATDLEACGKCARTQRICVVDGRNSQQESFQTRIRSVSYRVVHQTPGDLLRLVLKDFEHSSG